MKIIKIIIIETIIVANLLGKVIIDVVAQSDIDVDIVYDEIMMRAKMRYASAMMLQLLRGVQIKTSQ